MPGYRAQSQKGREAALLTGRVYEAQRVSGRYGEEHPYTIASASGDDELRIGIKAVGDATRALVNIKPGAEVRIEGPYGTFFETTGLLRHEGVPANRIHTEAFDFL